MTVCPILRLSIFYFYHFSISVLEIDHFTFDAFYGSTILQFGHFNLQPLYDSTIRLLVENSIFKNSHIKKLYTNVYKNKLLSISFLHTYAQLLIAVSIHLMIFLFISILKTQLSSLHSESYYLLDTLLTLYLTWVPNSCKLLFT